jgi:hypothetical protein
MDNKERDDLELLAILQPFFDLIVYGLAGKQGPVNRSTHFQDWRIGIAAIGFV